jgi:hypothetical protein
MHEVHLGYFKGHLLVYWAHIALINMSLSSVVVYDK